MPKAPKTTLIGLLGPRLDGGHDEDRWARWRPSVAAFQHEHVLIDRCELLHERRFDRLAEQVARDIVAVSPETDARLHPLELDDPWDFEEVYASLHDFAVGYPFDPDRESYLLNITTGTHAQQICLFLLCESHHMPGRLLQLSPPRRGTGPGDLRIIDLDLSRYDRIAQRFRQAKDHDVTLLKAGIETEDPAFNALIDRIGQVASASKDPILLTGPTGAGKSHLARRIYELKRRRRLIGGSLVEVNCATLRGDGAMSTLFGHRRGAFTGAARDREGLLRAADGGMLFLDEIGELGLDEQAMLLRAVEEKRFLPMGTDREEESSFQLIAGTNRDLGRAVARGRFRDDLLARIDLWTFVLPGLAERRADIAPNLDYELRGYTERSGDRVAFTREARQRFLSFANDPASPWHGNFRDLNAAVVRMATLAAGGRITPPVVDEEIARLRASWCRHAESEGANSGTPMVLAGVAPETLDLFDRVQLAEVIRTCRTSRSLSDAGRHLFAVSRRRRATRNDADRLRKYLARFGLDWDSVTKPDLDDR